MALHTKMAAETTKKKYFDFFALPPELRDLIYDELTQTRKSVSQFPNDEDHISSRPRRAAYVHVANFPLTDILRVSRRFNSEYRRRLLTPVTLILSDHSDFDFSKPDLTGPQLASVKCMVYHGVFRCLDCLDSVGTCEIKAECGRVAKWFNERLLPSMPGAESSLHGNNLEDAFSLITALPTVTAITVYDREDLKEEVNESPGAKEIYAIWTRAGGWKAAERLESAEQSAESEAEQSAEDEYVLSSD